MSFPIEVLPGVKVLDPEDIDQAFEGVCAATQGMEGGCLCVYIAFARSMGLEASSL